MLKEHWKCFIHCAWRFTGNYEWRETSIVAKAALAEAAGSLVISYRHYYGSSFSERKHCGQIIYGQIDQGWASYSVSLLFKRLLCTAFHSPFILVKLRAFLNLMPDLERMQCTDAFRSFIPFLSVFLCYVTNVHVHDLDYTMWVWEREAMDMIILQACGVLLMHTSALKDW